MIQADTGKVIEGYKGRRVEGQRSHAIFSLLKVYIDALDSFSHDSSGQADLNSFRCEFENGYMHESLSIHLLQVNTKTGS